MLSGDLLWQQISLTFWFQFTVTGEVGVNLEVAQGHVEEDHEQNIVSVTILLLPTEESSVRE